MSASSLPAVPTAPAGLRLVNPREVPIPKECAEIWDLRDQAIYRRGFADGMHRANNDATPTVGDLELRLAKGTDLLRQAIDTLNTPSF